MCAGASRQTPSYTNHSCTHKLYIHIYTLALRETETFTYSSTLCVNVTAAIRIFITMYYNNIGIGDLNS